MSIRKGQARLRKISKDIENDLPLSKKDKDFLCSALMQIASGEDAELALDVKAKKGERKSEHSQQTKTQLKFFMPWIASAIEPEEEGGLLNSERSNIGCQTALPKFALRRNTTRYWADYQRTGTAIFTLERDLNGDLSPR